jgi:hypothetical protein
VQGMNCSLEPLQTPRGLRCPPTVTTSSGVSHGPAKASVSHTLSPTTH